MILCVLVAVFVLAAGALFMLSDEDSVGVESATTTYVTSSTSTTTSTLSSTSTSTSTTTSTTTTSTSTTTLCGSLSDKPCAVGGCDDGLILDSSNLCQDPECAPSIASGKDGCGSFALSYCNG